MSVKVRTDTDVLIWKTVDTAIEEKTAFTAESIRKLVQPKTHVKKFSKAETLLQRKIAKMLERHYLQANFPPGWICQCIHGWVGEEMAGFFKVYRYSMEALEANDSLISQFKG